MVINVRTSFVCETFADPGGLPPLLRAATDGLAIAVRELLRAPRLDLNATAPRSGKTALVLASRAGHLEVVQMLLGAGADVSLGDAKGWTALHFAAWKGHMGETPVIFYPCGLLWYVCFFL